MHSHSKWKIQLDANPSVDIPSDDLVSNINVIREAPLVESLTERCGLKLG